jgi:F-type H+-transporting ATPase subunit alpha
MPPDAPDWFASAQRRGARSPGSATRTRGRVEEIGDGVAMISGLRDVRLDEVLRFEGGQFGFARVLDPDLIGCVFIDAATKVEAGDAVFGTGEVVSVPVGERCSGASSTRSAARWTERGRSRPRSGGRSSARRPRSSNAIS